MKLSETHNLEMPSIPLALQKKTILWVLLQN